MQKLFSLIALGIIGGFGFLFLQGGGLNQVGQQQAGQPQIYRPPVNQPQAGFPSQGGAPAPNNVSVQPPISSRSVPPLAGTGADLGPAGGPVLRIASFNIRDFGPKKASKSYVMYTLADIVRRFDIVAVQEISSKNQYLTRNFVNLINQSGSQYDYVIGQRLGNSNQKEQYAYIFNTARVRVDRQSVYTLGDPDNMLHREPLVATFEATEANEAERFTFTLINIHTDPSRNVLQKELDALAEVYRVVRRSSQEDDIILLGDFNADDRHMRRLGELPGIYPLISGVWTNTRQNKQYDNLVIHQPSTTEYSGRSGVFDVIRHYNLNQKQALEVSDHFPVWAEFSIYERDHNGRIASRQFSSGR